MEDLSEVSNFGNLYDETSNSGVLKTSKTKRIQNHHFRLGYFAKNHIRHLTCCQISINHVNVIKLGLGWRIVTVYSIVFLLSIFREIAKLKYLTHSSTFWYGQKRAFQDLGFTNS